MSEQEIPERIQAALHAELSPDDLTADEQEVWLDAFMEKTATLTPEAKAFYENRRWLGLGVGLDEDGNLVRGRDTQTSESRAEKLRVLADIVEDKFGSTVWFEQHHNSKYYEISAFHVFYMPAYGGEFDKAYIVSKTDPARDFVEAALPKIGIHVRSAELRETTFIELRPESASADEKVAMLRILNRGIHD
ncbi:hypothetical protein [Ruegeria sp. MALMAid1280]|uniref:hypothetical protein n=1 Tax=Ruegeria sp. MALMAid1280 TaxID=3411634 RepID=UPI003B9F4B06